MPRLLWLLALPLLFAAQPLSAWSEPGHRLIAALAEQALSPDARRAARELLADEPAERLADVAGWADRARDVPAYAWSKPLHFVNLGRDCRYRPTRHCPAGDCVVGAVERFAAELGNPELPRARRAEALKWLVHFVGDLHQPLHAGFAHDLGGNRHQLQLDDKGTNLHAVWDGSILAASGLDHREHLDRLGREPLPVAGPIAPAGWAEESCRLIGAHELYPVGRRIDQAYLQRFAPLAEARLRLAAARLAAIIEAALPAQRAG